MVLSALVVVMFESSGVLTTWVYTLTDLMAWAVYVIIGAMTLVVGVYVFFTYLRSLVPGR